MSVTKFKNEEAPFKWNHFKGDIILGFIAIFIFSLNEFFLGATTPPMHKTSRIQAYWPHRSVGFHEAYDAARFPSVLNETL